MHSGGRNSKKWNFPHNLYGSFSVISVNQRGVFVTGPIQAGKVLDTMSSVLAPQPAPSKGPGPTIVPPAQEPRKRRTALLGVILAVVVIAGGTAYYLKNKADARNAGGATLVVPTVAVSLGDLTATVRVNGTVAAQNSAAMLAPRIMGSRGDINRGGDGQGGGRAVAGPGRRWRWRWRLMGGGPGGDFTLVLLHWPSPASM